MMTSLGISVSNFDFDFPKNLLEYFLDNTSLNISPDQLPQDLGEELHLSAHQGRAGRWGGTLSKLPGKGCGVGDWEGRHHQLEVENSWDRCEKRRNDKIKR
jgi:hypothetical protein